MLVSELGEQSDHHLARAVGILVDATEQQLERALVVACCERRLQLRIGDRLGNRRLRQLLEERVDRGAARAPTNSATTWPFRNALTAGMPRMPYSLASA